MFFSLLKLLMLLLLLTRREVYWLTRRLCKYMQILENFAHVESELEFVAKEVQYHNSCRNTFHNQASSKTLRILQFLIEEEEKSERIKKIEIGEQAFLAPHTFKMWFYREGKS